MSKNVQYNIRTDDDILNLFSGIYDKDTYNALKADIEKYGIKVKGVVASSPDELKGIIVCGNQRYKISQELGIEFLYITVDFESKEDLMKYAKNDNILRRQLNVAQKIAIESKFIDWLKKTRQENVKNNLPNTNKLTNSPMSSVDDTGKTKGRTNELLAEKVGTSPKTAERVLYVLDKGSKDVKQQMLSGELTPTGAAKKTRKSVKKKKKKDQENLIKISNFESNVEWTDYGINTYLGCSHDCDYCYGKLMNKKFNWVEKWTSPRKRNIDLKDLAKKLKKLDKGSFFFCSVTDAYQPLNKKENYSRGVLKVLLESKHDVIILTKSAFVEDDFDLISKHKNVEVGFTIINIDDEENKKYEPNSSPPSERIRVLKDAHEKGIKTLVSIEPWIIGHTKPLEIISNLKEYVDRWIIGVYNYSDTNLEDYRPYMAKLLDYLIQNEIKFRLKEELVRVIKSYDILTKKEYEESVMQQVGDK